MRLLQTTLIIIKLSSQSSNLLLVTLIVNLELKTMVLLSKLIDVLFVPVAQFLQLFLSISFQSFMRNFQKFELPLRLIIVISRLFKCRRFLLDFESILRFNIFLQSHTQNVRIDRQLHFTSQRLQLILLLVNDASHLRQSVFELVLQAFARLYFFDQARLI